MIRRTMSTCEMRVHSFIVRSFNHGMLENNHLQQDIIMSLASAMMWTMTTTNNAGVHCFAAGTYSNTASNSNTNDCNMKIPWHYDFDIWSGIVQMRCANGICKYKDSRTSNTHLTSACHSLIIHMSRETPNFASRMSRMCNDHYSLISSSKTLGVH